MWPDYCPSFVSRRIVKSLERHTTRTGGPISDYIVFWSSQEEGRGGSITSLPKGLEDESPDNDPQYVRQSNDRSSAPRLPLQEQPAG